MGENTKGSKTILVVFCQGLSLCRYYYFLERYTRKHPNADQSFFSKELRLFWGKFKFQALQFNRDGDLTSQTWIRSDMISLIKHGFLIIVTFPKMLVRVDVNLTRCTHCHSATYPFDSKTVDFADFHQIHIHICRGGEFMWNSFTINNCYVDITQWVENEINQSPAHLEQWCTLG